MRRRQKASLDAPLLSRKRRKPVDEDNEMNDDDNWEPEERDE